MNWLLKIGGLVLAVIVLFLSSCKREMSCERCAGRNKPPTAAAGQDLVIVLPKDSVLLDGSASSDPDGTITTYLWKRISGQTSAAIVSTASATTSVKNLVTGIYDFELTVTDGGGLYAKDTVRVTVDSVITTNHPPIANAGQDQIITLPISTVMVDGGGSDDPDNNITDYIWTRISGPSSFVISDPNNIQTQITNLIQGEYEFELKVTDSGGLFARDTIEVVVNREATVNCGYLSKTKIGTLSIQRNSVSILTAGSKILFAGGFVSPESLPIYGASSRVDIYDRITNNWSRADLSLVRFHMGTIAAGNEIFFAGGSDGNKVLSRVDIYNASSNIWSTAELSEARTSVIAVAAGNRVLFAGGIDGTGPSKKVDIYDQGNGTWSTFTLSGPIAGSYYGKYEIGRSGVILLGTKIYFILGSHEIAIYDAQLNTWSEITSSPELHGATALSMGNQIFFSAIIPGGLYANLLGVYHTSGASWSSHKMIQPRSDMAAVAADNKIFWAGGTDSSYSQNGNDYTRCIDNIEIYDINTNSNTLHKIPVAACWVRVVMTTNKIFFALSNNHTEIYDMNSDSWASCDLNFNQTIAIGNTVYQIDTDNLQVWKFDF